MNGRLTPGNLLSIALLLAIVFFGWRFARVLIWPIQPPQIGAVAGGVEVPKEELPPPPKAPGEAQLAEFSRRPLFWESRRPIVAAKPVEQVKEKPKVEVAGIIVAGGSRIALLAGEGKPVQRVTEGAEFEGWKVARIQQDKVVLESEQGLLQLPYDPRQRFMSKPAAVNGGAQKPPVPGRPPVPPATRPQPPQPPAAMGGRNPGAERPARK